MSPQTFSSHQVHYQYLPGQPGVGKTLKIIPPPSSSPMQQVPNTTTHLTAINRKKQVGPVKESGFPKPAYSYSCLIALALKNSPAGSMSVSEIYKFMW